MQALSDTKWASAGRAPGQNLKGPSGVLVDLIVLTSDAGLIAQTQEASSGRHALWQANTAEEVVEHLVAGRCGILLADLQVLRGNTKAFFERLNQQFPTLVLIAAGKREEEGEVAQLITTGRLYRFLHKPLSPGRTQQFVGAATRRYFELNERASPSLADVAERARGRISQGLVTYGVRVAAGVAVCAVGALLIGPVGDMLESTPETDVAHAPKVAPTPAPAAAPTTPIRQSSTPVASSAAPRSIAQPVQSAPLEPNKSIPPAAAASPVKAMLDQAMMAIEQGRLISPPGENALELVRQAQGIAPDDSRLLITATALGQRLLAEAKAAMSRNDGIAAEEWIATAQALDTDLGLYLPEMQATRAELDQLTQAARDHELRMLVTIATERREAGLLIEPQGGSAYDQISLLRERDPSSAIVAAEAQRLTAAMMERAKASLARNDLHYSRRLLASIDVLQPNLDAAQPIKRELAFAEKQSQSLRDAIAANNLRRVVEVAPEYPLVARERGTEGWVEVEFTIEKDGSVTSPMVRSAEPMDLFNKPAVDAVKRWRFEPVIFDGRPIVQRAYLRLTFKLR